MTSRVVGVDINAAYIESARSRFLGQFRTLELYSGDMQTTEVRFDPVDMFCAAPVFEYLDLSAALMRIASLVARGGILGTVLQLSSVAMPAVTPSPFQSLERLAPVMRLVPPEQLRAAAEPCVELSSGKCFQIQVFRT